MECPFIENETSADLRGLYFRGLNTESYPSAVVEIIEYSRNALSTLDSKEAHSFTELDEITRRSTLEAFRAKLTSGGKHQGSVDEDRLRYALLQFAPFLRIDGGHLAGVAALKFACGEAGAALLRIHSRAVGEGDVGKSRSTAFDFELQKLSISLPAPYAAEFSFDLRVADGAFRLPLFLLGLSQAPDRFFAETLGVNLAVCLTNPLRDFLPGKCSRWNTLRGMTQAEDEADAELAIDAAMRELPGDGVEKESFIRRVELGFIVFGRLLREFLNEVSVALSDDNRFTSQGKLLAVLQRIGTRPHGYHKRGKMGGHSIDYWFAPERFDPLEVLRALAKSPYIIPGAPERSRFLTQLTQVSGPMYRIFSDQELKLFAEWIRVLPPSRELLVEHRSKFAAMTGRATEPESAPDTSRQPHSDLRELYFRLVNEYENRDYWPSAYHFARKWLNDHERDLKKDRGHVPFAQYSHEKLDEWLDKKHAEQVESYRPLEACPEEAKEDVVHTAIQLAPLTMIDGAWLRAFVAPELVSTRVGSLLYHIYVDELGNGDIKTHHGNIYRALVASMGHDLPSFTSPEFAQLQLFDDDAFEVPVFWLSVSLFPRTFMPEILGLNLAMELSGVGGEYRRSGDVLRHYGFSAQFTELHNSIDNVATGHTAWAIDAIKAHLDEMNLRGGATEANRHWRRVWIGYRALQPPQRRPLLIEALSRLFK
ncbi:iron-containing redox enzyme family protein [Agrobacterium vitis]|nr:iron-containing redox enzyme family protein [Agrobacterium vitis]